VADRKRTSKPEVRRASGSRKSTAAKKTSHTGKKKAARTADRKAARGSNRSGSSGRQAVAKQSPPKTRKKLSKAAKERMDRLRVMLEQRRAEILSNIRKAREDTLEANRSTFSEVGDLVSASLEKEMVFKYGEQGVNMLREIDSALEKLKEGNYGVCEACGKNIGVKRLEVVPSARLCIKCKSMEEGKGAGSI
jgi:DnaK suppressor protein